jgi:predicted dehydrogenase
MKDTLPRICFFGCGYISSKHSKILRGLFPKIELSYASRNSSKSKKYRDKFKGKNYFGSYDEAAKSDIFDIAFITTPHAYHSELAILVAENKKDIIIEKPITRNLKEFSAIEKTVNTNGVRCTVSENYFYKPFIKKLREHIEEGLIGEILFIEINKTNRDRVSGWRTDAEMMGGGALLEGGSHWVNQLVSLAGSSPVEVIALKSEIRYDTKIPFEDTVLLNVRFKNGIIGKLFHSWRIPNPLRGVGLSKIYGTEGVITFESNGLFFSLSGKKRKFYLTNPLNFLGFKAMHRAFIEAYMKNLPWEPSLERIKTELNLIEKAYRSLKTKKIERL